jgi:hypothetical protein
VSNDADSSIHSSIAVGRLGLSNTSRASWDTNPGKFVSNIR